MTLRTKMLTIVGALLAALAVALLVTSITVFLKGFLRIEEDNTRKNILRAIDAYREEIANLTFTSADWASWDDTYAFITDKN